VTPVKADGPTRLSKKEVNLALNDFAQLAASVDGSFTAKGLTIEKLGASSVFTKAGLQVGDTVTAIDGKPLKTIDDAADLYARAGSMTRASVQILRAGKPQTLRIAIQ
jgi:serine protease Do